MQTISLTDFERQDVVLSDETRTVCRAIDLVHGNAVRLTVFSRAISQDAGFRRSLKTDIGMLKSLRHHAIPEFLGAGEADGCLLLWTQDCGCRDLNSILGDGRMLSVEDIIEIGWQACSALQQAHNAGLSHGGLTDQSLLLSSDLRVFVVDFGVKRWIQPILVANSEQSSTVIVSSLTTLMHWRREISTDLRSLAMVLQQSALRMQNQPESATNSVLTSGSLLRLLERITQHNESSHPISARDFQGRLGELLIGTDDDQIELLDQRGQSYRSSRSIVDELFDDVRSTTPDNEVPGGADSAAPAALRQKPLVLLAIAAAVILLILAVIFM